ncbi:hypothetical protein [Vitreimonas sp.]|uniref:hypothetical protein n=1 Tax=Vitreimonas sp. TaxID=3069702 RepID=UPI002EDA301B
MGTVVNLLKLPVYLDAIGTVACALLAGRLGLKGFALAALVGAASFTISGLLFTPAVLWFIPTQVVIAAIAFFIIRPALKTYLAAGPFPLRAVILTILLGVLLGVIAGIVSAPIIAYVFGGITGSGPSLIVAVLLRSGQNLLNAVVTAGIATELLDKTIQLAVAIALVRMTPGRIRRMFF